MGGPKDLPMYFCEHYTMIQCITSTSIIVGTGLSLRLCLEGDVLSEQGLTQGGGAGGAKSPGPGALRGPGHKSTGGPGPLGLTYLFL